MQEPPLTLGPVYLHWDGSYESNETYPAFFAHMQCKLDHINIRGLEFSVRDLVVGSFEERALMKAVETCLPQATTLLCCRHLEENVRRQLQDNVGIPAQVRQDTVGCVFGAEGLAGSAYGSLSTLCRDAGMDAGMV